MGRMSDPCPSLAAVQCAQSMVHNLKFLRVLQCGLVATPGEQSSEEAAPILCAGVAIFNASKKSGAEEGDLVAILGIGGLGIWVAA